MKVCLIHTGNPYKIVGGVETYLLNLAKYIKNEGHQVYIAFSELKENLILKILRKTIRIDVSELLRDFVSASKAVKLRADIYHGYGGALYPLLKLKLPKKSFVATLHGTTYGLMKATFPTLHYRIAVLQKEKITQHFSDMIIAVSKQVMLEAIKFYHTPEEKIRIIYNGVDTPLFNSIKKEDAKNCLKIPLDIPVISFIGRCDHQKGADKLIQIIKYLMKHSLYDKLLIQIVGWGGKYFKEVQELSQRLQNRVILRSFIPYKEVILRVSASDIFIFPTRYEGHSIALLEAMAAGNAIITSKLPSIQETLNEREGILIEVDKPIEEWCKALEKLLNDDKLLKKFQELARKKAYEFPLERTLKETMNVYYELTSLN